MFKYITSKPLWVNILVAIAFSIGVFVLLYLSLGFITGHGKTRTVPSVVNKSYEKAVAELKALGFDVEVQDSIYSENYKPLQVIKQVPEGDAIVKNNRTVYLVINRAVPPLVEVPKLTSYGFRTAEMVMKNSGFKLGDTTFRSYFARHAVLEMLYNGRTIQAGEKIPFGSTISLVLGTGVGNTQMMVPELVGLTYAEALAILRENGIEFGSIIAPGIKDTAIAYIYWQRPTRFDDEKRPQYIKTGQLMDIRLQVDVPETEGADSTGAKQENNEE